jgi:hypothetical protein
MVNNALTTSEAEGMRQEDAETIALNVLAWLAADEDMLRNFCRATGTAPADLRRAASDPEFLAGVLDFVALDDAWVSAFADAAGVPPDAPARARAALPGGTAPHWT